MVLRSVCCLVCTSRWPCVKTCKRCSKRASKPVGEKRPPPHTEIRLQVQGGTRGWEAPAAAREIPAHRAPVAPHGLSQVSSGQGISQGVPSTLLLHLSPAQSCPGTAADTSRARKQRDVR